MPSQRCNICKLTLPADMFSPSSRRKTGAYCKDCKYLYNGSTEWYEAVQRGERAPYRDGLPPSKRGKDYGFIPPFKSKAYEQRQREFTERTQAQLAKLDTTYPNLEEYKRLDDPYIQSLFALDDNELRSEEQSLQRQIATLSRLSTLISNILNSRLQ